MISSEKPSMRQIKFETVAEWMARTGKEISKYPTGYRIEKPNEEKIHEWGNGKSAKRNRSGDKKET